MNNWPEAAVIVVLIVAITATQCSMSHRAMCVAEKSAGIDRAECVSALVPGKQ